MANEQVQHQIEFIERLVELTVANAANLQAEVEETTGILLDVNRLSAVVSSKETSGASANLIESLLSRLGRIMSRNADAGGYVKAMIHVVNKLAAAGLSCSLAEKPRKRRGDADVEYFVREGARGLRLVESRGTLKDFFVTQTDVDHAIDAIAQVAKPRADFDVIHERFIQLGGSETRSAYPLRVVLRFLRSRGLVLGARGTYSVGELKSREFRTKAKAAWNALDKN